MQQLAAPSEHVHETSDSELSKVNYLYLFSELPLALYPFL